jgi:hypothetical protein
MGSAMPKRPQNFRPGDVMRAVKALREAGETITNVRFQKDGGFAIEVASKSGEPEAETSPLEAWKAHQHARDPQRD